MSESPFAIQRMWTFEAAHRLPNVPSSHKCSRLHGHSYLVTVTIRGPLLEEFGWVLDFAEVDTLGAPIISQLDHRLLNDVPGLENPTSELLAQWIYRQLRGAIPGLRSVEVRETPRSAAIYGD